MPQGVEHFFERVTIFCFAASYGTALLLEVVHLLRPRPAVRLFSLGFGSAGLLAHTIFLAVQRPDLATRAGSLLFLAWIVAIFYLYGTLHHRKIAWGLFVLPLILGLIGLGVLLTHEPASAENSWERVCGSMSIWCYCFWRPSALWLGSSPVSCIWFKPAG